MSVVHVLCESVFRSYLLLMHLKQEAPLLLLYRRTDLLSLTAMCNVQKPVNKEAKRQHWYRF